MSSRETIYSYIVDYALKYNRLPNVSEIAEACFMTRNSVGYVMDKLVEDGKIKYKDGKPSAYTVIGINYRDEREVAS